MVTILITQNLDVNNLAINNDNKIVNHVVTTRRIIKTSLLQSFNV